MYNWLDRKTLEQTLEKRAKLLMPMGLTLEWGMSSATSEDIAFAEAQIGFAFPIELREFLTFAYQLDVSVSDGNGGPLDQLEFYSLAAMVEITRDCQWLIKKELESSHHQLDFNPSTQIVICRDIMLQDICLLEQAPSLSSASWLVASNETLTPSRIHEPLQSMASSLHEFLNNALFAPVDPKVLSYWNAH